MALTAERAPGFAVPRALKWAIGAALVVVAAAVVVLELFSTSRFPTPTGPYRVGTRIYPAWTDAARSEPFTANPADRRQVAVQIWYPTQAEGPKQRYVEHRDGFRDVSLFWIEELASYGYVMVGMDQHGTAAATVLGGTSDSGDE